LTFEVLHSTPDNELFENSSNMGWWSGSSIKRTYLASLRPRVQTLVPKKKKKENSSNI
jgi:hypothetical protein